MVQPRFSFSAPERIKSRKLIGQLFEKGQSFSHFPFRAVYIFPGKNRSYLQAAFSVSAKNFKKATQRNRIKRLMRESYRLKNEPLKTFLKQNEMYLAIFIIFTGKEIPAFDHVSQKMNSVLIHAIDLARKEHAIKKAGGL